MKAFIAIRKLHYEKDFVVEGVFKTLAIANQYRHDPDFPSEIFSIDFDKMQIVQLTEEPA